MASCCESTAACVGVRGWEMRQVFPWGESWPHTGTMNQLGGGRGGATCTDRWSECRQVSQLDVSLPQTFDLMQIASEEWLIVMLVYFLLGRCAHVTT